MPTEDAIQLAREAKRANQTLLPFNEELFRNVLRETRHVYQEAQSTYHQLDRTDESSMTKSIMLQFILKRNQRILLAYVNSRLEVIRNLVENNAFKVQNGVQNNLSKWESDFTKNYEQLLHKHWKQFPSLQGNCNKPPKDLYIEVRVLKDCGTIQTESGEIALTENSHHFVKRNDVEHLVSQAGALMKESADSLQDDFNCEKKTVKRKSLPDLKKKSTIKREKKVPFASLSIENQCQEYHNYYSRANKSLTDLEKREFSPDRFRKANFEYDSTDLCYLNEFVKNVLTDSQSSLKAGLGHKGLRCLILTGSAVRAVSAIRALDSIKPLGKIGKLFAKHMKMQEQIYFLDNFDCRIAVGTCQRVKQLVESGSLKLDELQMVIIDSARDGKERILLDEKDLFELIDVLDEKKNNFMISFY